jgi:hypothetical protein
MLLVAAALEGYTVEADDGPIGTVSDLLFDDLSWQSRWLVVDTGGWLTGRKVLVHPSAVRRADYERQTVAVTLTKVQVKDSPPISSDRPLSRQVQTSLYGYYGWDPLWGSDLYDAGTAGGYLGPPRYFGGAAAGVADKSLDGDDSADPHLRSAAEVKGYHVHATDGDIGHIENLMIDVPTWGVRYLVIDTSNWWMGKHVLVSPYAVTGIGWADRKVDLDVTRDRVKNSPSWDPLALIDHNYQRRLHGYYGWPGYGW